MKQVPTYATKTLKYGLCVKMFVNKFRSKSYASGRQFVYWYIKYELTITVRNGGWEIALKLHVRSMRTEHLRRQILKAPNGTIFEIREANPEIDLFPPPKHKNGRVTVNRLRDEPDAWTGWSNWT